MQRRDGERREHVPVADLVVPLVAQAGDAGISRGEIGKAVGNGLQPETLDALLNGLVEFGLVIVTREYGHLVYRTPEHFPGTLA